MSAPTLPPVAEPVVRRPASNLLRTPAVGSLAAALSAAVIGLALAAVPMLVLWLSSLESGWAGPVRQTGLLWLVSQGAPISIAGITVDLLPWGLVLIPLILLASGGAWATRRSGLTGGPQLIWIIAPGAVLYTVVGGVVDLVVAEPAARVDLLHAIVACLVVSALGLTWGAVRGAGLLAPGRLAAIVAVPLRAGVTAAAVIVIAGAVAATVSLLVSIDDAITMIRALGPGIGGGLGLLALGIAYLPVIVVWGSAYLLGAGVVVGPTVTLSPFLPATAPTALPPFPLLAALPQQAPPMAWALPVVGVLAGIAAGLLIGRRLRHEQRLVRLACAAVASAVAGGLLAGLAWLSAGSLGTQNLAHLGPDPSVVGMLTVVLVGIGALPVALAPSAPSRPALSVAGPEPVEVVGFDVDADVDDGVVTDGSGDVTVADEPRAP